MTPRMMLNSPIIVMNKIETGIMNEIRKPMIMITRPVKTTLVRIGALGASYPSG